MRTTCDPADLVENTLHQFFADSVVATSVVVCSIFFATNEQLRMKQLTVITCTNLVDWGWV